MTRIHRFAWIVLPALLLAAIVLVAGTRVRAELTAQPDAPAGETRPVQRRSINRLVKDFPEKTDLSTPESALAAYHRASAGMDANAVLQLGWRKFGPYEIEEMERFWKKDPKDIAVYNQAKLDAEILEVLTHRDDHAAVICKLKFPEGVGRNPYSRRSFGRINGVWKNLGEDRLPSLEAARDNYERKKGRLWQGFVALRDELTSGRTSPPPQRRARNFEPAPDPGVYAFGPEIERTLAATGRGRGCFLDFETGKLSDGPDPEQVKPPPPGREVAGLKAWAAQQGIDLLGEGGALCGLELVLLPANNRSWDEIPRGRLVALLKQAEPATPALLQPAKELPMTLFFRTREGAMGVLQVVDFVEHKVGGRGLKVRYRLLQRKGA